MDPTFGASALKANTSIPVTGTISSTNSLTSVGAYIFYENNGVGKKVKVTINGVSYGGTVNPSFKTSTNSYDLSLMQKNKKIGLSFNLPGGSYIYEIDATDCDGQNLSIVQHFTVEGGTPPPQHISDTTVVNNTDYAGNVILSQSDMSLVTANKQFYINSGNKYGVPWQMIAAIHYREHRFSRSGPKNGYGPYQITPSNYPIGAYTDTQFQDATDKAAAFIKGKAGGRDLSNSDNVKYTFFAYNGVSSKYETQAANLNNKFGLSLNPSIGDGSPYVMNLYDKYRDPTIEPTKSNKTWGQIKKDYGPLEYPANTDYGAYIIYMGVLGGGGDNPSPSNPSTPSTPETPEDTTTAKLIVQIANGMQPWGIVYNLGGGHSSLSDLQMRIDHQFHPFSYGVDCSGFVRAVVYEATGYDVGPIVASGGNGNYKPGTGKILGDGSKYFTPIDIAQAKPGDIFVVNDPDNYAHMGIVTGTYTSAGVPTVDVNNHLYVRSKVIIYRYAGPVNQSLWKE